jgi:hypothetical protein
MTSEVEGKDVAGSAVEAVTITGYFNRAHAIDM